MKKSIWILLVFPVLMAPESNAQRNTANGNAKQSPKISAFRDLLVSLNGKSDQPLFKKNYTAFIMIIDANKNPAARETDLLEKIYDSFINENNIARPGKNESYLARKRPLMIAWVSPTDHVVSFTWLTLPKNWDPAKRYPLYVMLHGDWNVAASQVEYLSYPLLVNYAASDQPSGAFEDGYLINPWGRGNNWYHGIGETDIRECISTVEKLVKVDPKRKYLSGHSMGGYGAWNIARASPGTWAAVGLYSAALWRDNRIVTPETVEKLKKVPVYFACGINEGLKPINEQAFDLLKKAGNNRVSFITFGHGHEYHTEDVVAMYLWLKKYKKD